MSSHLAKKFISFFPLDTGYLAWYHTCMSTTAPNIPAVFIPATLLREITVIEITPELSSLYPVIGCEIAERVTISPEYHAAMWVDEMGLCKDAPINLRASCIAGRALYGDAVLAGEDAEGNIAPLVLNCPSQFFKTVEEEVANLLMESLYEVK